MMTLRRRARQFVVQALYEAHVNQEASAVQIAQHIREMIGDVFSEELTKLQARIDALASSSEENAERLQSLEAKLRKVQERQHAVNELFTEIFFGAYNHQREYMKNIRPLLDRSEDELNAVERAVLLMAYHELAQMPETPYPVIINEAIEITKTYGNADGYKFVNGILDKLVSELRPNDPPRA